ncbi:MAG TPA: hypothetical protein VFC26_03500 [Verrucomicrobiae bacterium]|nr:hypothetical protein [Verrucomicrobiae bacterium]
MRNWVGAWLCFATAVLIAGHLLKLSPTLQFYIALPLAAIAGIVCLVVLVVEKR